ncbi:MAG: O-antigen ligase family protein, partial [Nitrosomonas nitrosa]|nr:O-antigen ligase family protein [Nitrosomonas nitrosa]
LLMISWLFKMADSVTSLSCFIIGACILVWIRLRISARAKLFGSCVLFTGLLCLILQSSSDFMHTFVVGLGRDMTLTGRIDLWKDLIDMDTHPLIGSGYEIFWLGDRAEQLWAMYYWHPNQAHNGYLETYLNLGWIGLLLLIGVIISAYQKCNTKFRLEHGYGKFQMTFLTIVLLYNATEAAFHGVHLMCFSFFLVAMDIPHLSQFQTASRSHTK